MNIEDDLSQKHLPYLNGLSYYLNTMHRHSINGGEFEFKYHAGIQNMDKEADITPRDARKVRFSCIETNWLRNDTFLKMRFGLDPAHRLQIESGIRYTPFDSFYIGLLSDQFASKVNFEAGYNRKLADSIDADIRKGTSDIYSYGLAIRYKMQRSEQPSMGWLGDTEIKSRVWLNNSIKISDFKADLRFWLFGNQEVSLVYRRYIEKHTNENVTDMEVDYKYRLNDHINFGLKVENDPNSSARLLGEISARYVPDSTAKNCFEMNGKLNSKGKLQTGFIFKPMPGVILIQSNTLQLKKFSPDSAQFGLGFVLDI